MIDTHNIFRRRKQNKLQRVSKYLFYIQTGLKWPFYSSVKIWFNLINLISISHRNPKNKQTKTKNKLKKNSMQFVILCGSAFSVQSPWTRFFCKPRNMLNCCCCCFTSFVQFLFSFWIELIFHIVFFNVYTHLWVSYTWFNACIYCASLHFKCVITKKSFKLQ